MPESAVKDEAKTGQSNISLSPNSRTVLERRYLRKGSDGSPIETVDEMFYRVASHVAASEIEYGNDVEAITEEFYRILSHLHFMPNSPTFTGAGTPLGQLAACFVLPISDDMGKEQAGIFQTLRDAALIQQTGGGNGFSFSHLRPEGALVKSSKIKESPSFKPWWHSSYTFFTVTFILGNFICMILLLSDFKIHHRGHRKLKR